MRSRHSVRTTCSRCGLVEPSVEASAVVVDEASLRLVFSCPSCLCERSCPLDVRESRLLSNAGVPVVIGGAPLAQPRAQTPHPS